MIIYVSDTDEQRIVQTLLNANFKLRILRSENFNLQDQQGFFYDLTNSKIEKMSLESKKGKRS